LGDLVGEVGARVVVAADRDHREGRPIAAPEPPERFSERFADCIPDSGVDARASDQPAAAVTEDVGRHRTGEFPAALDRERVDPDESWLDLVVDDPLDLEEVCVLVAGVRLADDALFRVQPCDDR
jgi:hypothetical protein